MSTDVWGCGPSKAMMIASRTALEREAKGSDSLVGEARVRRMVPEYRGTREILWEAGGTTPQA